MYLSIEESSVARAWIQAMQRVFFEGDVVKTQYDSGDDFPSRDVTASIHVTNPLSEPLIFGKKAYLVNGMPIFCHPSDLYCVESIKGGYLSEVMSGEKDQQIWSTDPQAKSYPYTYHDRLFNYKPINREDLKNWKSPGDMGVIEKFIDAIIGVDQIKEAIKQLKRAAYTRRAQAVTWRPLADNDRDDPPCLQRVWFRIFDGKLRMDTHWRSRDLFGAWGANVNGMIQIMRFVASETGSEIGSYTDMSDSLHIYGKKKKIYKEVIPLLQRVQQKEGLFKPEYDQLLEKWLDEKPRDAD
jgi:thymidylate synthase